MKVEQTKEFNPVVITIESQDELNWLYACLNMSSGSAQDMWEKSLRQRGHLNDEVQMKMFSAISKLFNR